MDTLQSLFGIYYGIDWLTLLIGLTSSYMVSGGKLRLGFAIGIASCMGGLTLAVMSGQQGFIVYNALLIGMNIRGILRGDRREVVCRKPVNENLVMPREVAPMRAHAL